MNRLVVIAALLGFGLPTVPGQGSFADYERAAGLRKLTEGKVLNQVLTANWLPDNQQFWYRREMPGGRAGFVLVTAATGEKKPAFDHASLASALKQATGKDIAADKLSLDGLEFHDGTDKIRFRSGGKGWEFNLASRALTEASATNSSTGSLSSLPIVDAPRASRRTGAETDITFVNKTTNEVEVFWLSTEGQRVSYGRVATGEQKFQHTFAGHLWLAVAGAQTLGVFEATERPATAEITGQMSTNSITPSRGRGEGRRGSGRDESPDQHWTAFIRDNNVFIRGTDDKSETQLSRDGTSDDPYSSEFFWSPDSQKLVALRTAKGQEHKVYLVESSPKDQVQPKLHTIDYLKPGDKLARPRPQLFDISTKQQISVSDELFQNPWSLTQLRWDRDSSRFTFLYNQRGHQVLRIVAVDAKTGAAAAIVDERSKTFIDYSGKFFSESIETTGEIVWMTERDGWNHLYLHDAKIGRVKNQITKGEWVVLGVDRVDRDKRQIWFRAGGIDPRQDPYYIHHCRVNFDGSGLVTMTEGDGTHLIEYSPDKRFLIDTFSRVDQAPVHELRAVESGKRITELERADDSELRKAGWRSPERFVTKARDGETDIYGVIVRPTNFDATKKYPVIENIYAGPQGFFTPKAFSVLNRMQELAELGFIVVQMDGLGTSGRSKKFHDVCWKNIGDAGFPDRILWIKAAAAKHPEMDLTRVGIYGTSAGGQNSLGGLLTHGDFYKAGVSDCGCHDNRMDKIWWNEQWMGWPVGPHYDEQSNVTLAPKLQGKLLLMVGELDRNVDPASTRQVVNALIKANKDFEYLEVPGAGHGVAGTPYGKRRLQDFFVRALLGKEPRWNP